MFKRIGSCLSGLGLVAGALLLSAPTVQADSPESKSTSQCVDTIALPNGFQPEGIVFGNGSTIYVGSIPTGAIFQADVTTGEGSILVPAQEGRQAIGLDFDARTNLIYVAGGPTGQAYAYDADTGDTVAVFQLTTETATFVNDQIVADDAVFFTDSQRAVLYRVPLGMNGELSPDAVPTEIPLTGDWMQVAGDFNANGIELSPDGNDLIVVNSASGMLFRVDPDNGVATTIDVGVMLQNGDGLLRRGNDLFVVRNSDNLIVQVDLNQSLDAGQVVQEIADARFDTPTTLDDFQDSLFVVNARFDVQPTPDTTYTVVRVPIVQP